MPAVGAAFTAIAGAFQATAVGSFLTTTFVGRLLTSVALSALKTAFISKPDSQQAGIRSQQTQTGGITPASFVLGRYATEGQLNCPPMSHGEDGKTPNAYLTYVVELGDIPGQALEGLIIDGESVALGTDMHADYGTPMLGRFTDHAWVKYYDGTQTAADPMLLDKYGDDPDRPWLADMVGVGICYAILTFRYNREIFSSFPSLRADMRGIPLYDPRYDSAVGGSGPQRWNDRSTWQPSENVEVQKYNILRGIDLGGGHIWGGAAEAEDLPLSNWWAEMNKADFAVVLDGGGTEPQWRASYEVFVNDEPAKVIEELNRGCSGDVVENGGIWKTRVGGPGLPLYFFTDADVIISEDEENTPFDGARQPYNGVQAVYPDPAALWEPKDAPALYNAAFEAEDGGQRRVADLSLTATPYPLQVQRVMLAYAQDERRFRQHLLNLPPEASMLEPLDVMSWTSQVNGYVAKDWEINSHVDPLTSGTSQFRIREVDQGDYFWSPDFEVPVGYANLNRTPPVPQPVAGFDFQAFALLDDVNAQRRPALRVLWDGDGQDDVRGIMWEIRLTGQAQVLFRGSTADVSSGFQLVVEGVLALTSYEARAQWIVDRPTDWTNWREATTQDIRLGQEDLSDLLWAQILADGQAAFDRQAELFDFVQDELAAVDLQNTVSQILEDARLEGSVEQTRQTLQVEIDDSKAQIEVLETTALTASEALAQLDTRLTADLGDVSSAVSTQQTALSTLDMSFSSFETNVLSQFAGNTGTLTQTFYTKAQADQVISASIGTVATNVDGLSASVTDINSSLNGVLASKISRFDVNGVVSGHSTIAELIDGQPVTRTVHDVDEFYIGRSNNAGDFVPAFAYQSGQIYMPMANIRDLDVETIKLAGFAVTRPKEADGGYLVGDGTWQQSALVIEDFPPGIVGDVVVNWSVEQGYANLTPTWGYQIRLDGTVVKSRGGMAAAVDFTGAQFTIKNQSGRVFIRLYWNGSSTDITQPGSRLEIRLIYR